MGASLGLATGQYATGESALQDADLAMYAAKANGKARVEVFEHRMRTSAIDRLEMVGDIRRARRGRAARRAPPADRRPAHAAGGGPRGARCAGSTPTRGLLLPTSFLALAEETGAIVPMGWWVLERACEEAATWPHRHGTDRREPRRRARCSIRPP